MAVRSVDVDQMLQANLVTWSGLLNLDTGEAYEAAEFADRAAQVTGTFGVGGTVSIEGSNDGTNWAILADPQGTPLTFTATKIEQLLESPRYIRPNVTAGDGSTALVVTVFCRRSLK